MEEKIKRIISDVNDEAVSYTGTNLLGDGIIDSFELIDIISHLEEELDIEIDARYVNDENFANCDSIINLIRNLTQNSTDKTSN